MTRRAQFLALCLCFCVGACATVTVQPVTPQQVVEMSQAGTPPEVIIQRMRDTGTVYQLSASDIVALNQQGVPAEVLNYMQGTYLAAVRAEEARNALLYSSPYSGFSWGFF